MRKIFICLLLAYAFNCFAQEEKVLTTVGILPSDGIGLSEDELERLTDEIRKAAGQVLTEDSSLIVLTTDAMIKRLGGATGYLKECKAVACIVDLGTKAEVDYVAKAIVNSVGLKIELYKVSTKGQFNLFTDDAKEYKSLLNVVQKNVPEFFGKIPGAIRVKKSSSARTIQSGVGDVQVEHDDYEGDIENINLIALSTNPSGASVSFDGEPDSRCKTTPCKLELPEGNVRIVAALDQYEKADTTVFIRQNNQSISITLKPNFGWLEVKPAYKDGIGKSENWNLTLNGKSYPLGENRLSPNQYKGVLTHRCYENISFPVGINKGKREVFDMAKHLEPKKSVLVLRAERGGEPVSEPVYVNGEKQPKETPFSGKVPICAKVEIGNDRETVIVTLKENEKIQTTHRFKFEEPKFDESEQFPQPKPPISSGVELVKISRWAAIGLDVLGAAMIGYAVYENAETKSAFDKYSERGHDPDYYADAWKKAEDHNSKRNMFYVIGGVLLASGIGVHIWF